MDAHLLLVTDETPFLIQPKDIPLPDHFWDAFDNHETERSAWWIIRLCQKNNGWCPFTYEEINTFYETISGHHGYSFNRLVNAEMVPPSAVRAFAGHYDPPVPKGGGWIVFGEDKKFRVTIDFIVRCFSSALRHERKMQQQPATPAA